MYGDIGKKTVLFIAYLVYSYVVRFAVKNFLNNNNYTFLYPVFSTFNFSINQPGFRSS